MTVEDKPRVHSGPPPSAATMGGTPQDRRRTHKCQHCGSSFKRAETLLRHCALTHSDGARPSRHICSLCAATFDDVDHLSAHTQTAHGHALESQRKHPCPHCPRIFLHTSHQARHVRCVHEKLREYQCPHCPKAFGHASHLTRHRRVVHEKRRDHQCPLCPIAFGQADTLSRHVRTVHETPREYGCPQCPHPAFKDQGSLQAHTHMAHPPVITQPMIQLIHERLFMQSLGLRS